MTDREQKSAVQFDASQPQSVEIVFNGTGDKGRDMPDSINIKVNQLTTRHLLYAAIALMDRAFKEFNNTEEKTSVLDYLDHVFLKAELGQSFIDKTKEAKDAKKAENKNDD